MKNNATKKIVLNGLMIALVFLATYATKIPGPVGPFNIGDAVVMITAILLGGKSGMLAGGLGSAVADIAMGYAFFSPFTLIVKGLEGYIVGAVTRKAKQEEIGTKRIAAGVSAGAVIMVAGYFLSEALILPIFNKEFGLAMAIKEMVSTNIIQGVVCAIIGYILYMLLIKANIMKYIS